MNLIITIITTMKFVHTLGVPRRQPHRRSGLTNMPSVGAVP